MITLITTSYNREIVLKHAMDSVLNQRFTDYEYLVIDGGSSDGTCELLREYEKKFSGRLKWISEKDNGIYDAINKGIKLSHGNIVGILNSDDFFHRDDALEIVARGFTDQSIDAIYADCIILRNKNGIEKHFLKSNAFFKNWMFRIGIMPSHGTFYAKKSLFEKYGVYKTNYKITADFELMLRFMYINKINTHYINESLFTFSDGGVSSHWSNKIKLNAETTQSCKDNGLFCCLPMIWMKYLFKLKKILFQI